MTYAPSRATASVDMFFISVATVAGYGYGAAVMSDVASGSIVMTSGPVFPPSVSVTATGVGSSSMGLEVVPVMAGASVAAANFSAVRQRTATHMTRTKLES